jgi:hypothetical protein
MDVLDWVVCLTLSWCRVELTQKSGEECSKVISHLFSRLNLRRPKIKLKALALIRQLLTRGPAQCKREILRRSELLRACLCTSLCPPQPTHSRCHSVMSLCS